MSKSVVLGSVLLGLITAACGPSARANGDGGQGSGDGSSSTQVDGGICAGKTLKAQQVPLDLFVMLDQSSSMGDTVAGGTKWKAVSTALSAFVGQPGLDGVSVGIQYFGLPAGGGTCSIFTCMNNNDCGAAACGPCLNPGGTGGICTGALTQAGDSCNAADYAGAAVEIAPLPAVASAITSSIAAHQPTTSTPTSAALQGAVDHAKAWATSHANDAVVVVLATDGDPTECDTDLGHIDAIAAGAFASPQKIPTFVIGVGSLLSNLNGIAAAGGTGQAFLVDTGGNVNQQFLDAMNTIRHAALGCQYQIPLPASGTPNYQEVNVVYTPAGGAPQTFPYVASKASCPATGNGWYYDDAAHPMQIILCDATCTEVKGDTTGQVDITLGCATILQ
jgi:hypothetical protein